MRTNYVLIDFESVQSASFEQLIHDHFKVIVFLGANQVKLPIELAKSLQPFGARAEYIQISGHGPNALDFHIAYYSGQLSAAEP
ncbi:MAG TPA: PIN domain-containing protein, partial [Pyrinomonadaceae bacterium]